MPGSLVLRSEYMKRTFTTAALTDPGADERPTSWSVRLHTANPGETGASEVSGSAYVAQTIGTMTRTDASVSNTVAIVYPTVTGVLYVVTHVSIWSVNGTPRCLYHGALGVSKSIAVGEAMSFAIGELICNVT